MSKSLSRAKGASFFVVGLSDDGISSTVQEFSGCDFHGAILHTRDFGITPMGIVATRSQADALAQNVREIAWDENRPGRCPFCNGATFDDDGNCLEACFD